MSEIAYSEKLGRTIRQGGAEALGRPTEELAVDALRQEKTDEAAAYLKYQRDEIWRVHSLYTTWLREMLAYGACFPEFETGVARLSELLGPAPLPEGREIVGGYERTEAEAALAAGDAAAFAAAFERLRAVQRAVHDAQADWSWGLLTLFFDLVGEDGMDEVFRATQADWLAKRYAAIAGLSAKESFELTIEGMRAHFCGPDRDGTIAVEEHSDRWVMSFDPCGSGGRMRRGDLVTGQSSRAKDPYAFAFAERAHDWTWNREGVCLYCAHCAVVNEILPIEQRGTPMRVTEYPKSPEDPCTWTVYKAPELVPSWVFDRVGRPRDS